MWLDEAVSSCVNDESPNLVEGGSEDLVRENVVAILGYGVLLCCCFSSSVIVWILIVFLFFFFFLEGRYVVVLDVL